MRLGTARGLYDADAAAIHVEGVPSEVLMGNAAAYLVRAALETMGRKRSCIVFCGPGNNGGDGAAAAALLRRHGVCVRALLVGRREEMSHACREMERRLERSGGALEDFEAVCGSLPGELEKAGVLIDAIFGIGLSRKVQGSALRAIRLMNASGVPVVAADIPSGVEADTGRILGEAVRCRRTVTFSLAKPGHFLEPGCDFCGRVEVVPIGLPEPCLEKAVSGTSAVFRQDVSLPPRPQLSHKGSFGRLLLLAGSVGYTGAPNLAARAAVRGGAGLVRLGVPRSIWGVCAVKNDEAMPFPLAEDGEGRLCSAALEALESELARCDVLAAGPGLGRSREVCRLLDALLLRAEKPVLLDADALWAAAEEPGMLARCRAPLLLTPHMGEFRRLGGEVTGDRLCDAGLFARRHGCTVVLKGHRTICAFPDGESAIICAGNAGMAKGGAGDVLTGLLGALLGQLPWKQAVRCGCWIHAAAGDACARERGEYGMTPGDMIEKLPEIMKDITEKEGAEY